MVVVSKEFTATGIETVHKVRAKNYFNELGLKESNLKPNDIIVILKDAHKNFYVSPKISLTIYVDEKKCVAYTKYGRVEIPDGTELKMKSQIELTIREVKE